MSYTIIKADEFKKRYAEDPALELIDVRTPKEFGEAHLTFAQNVPLDRLNPHDLLSNRNGNSGKPLYLICRSGKRSETACQKIVAAGYRDIVNVVDGTQACIDVGLPAIRGQKAMSLERQVRVAAGLLVLAGVVLGYLVHPWIFALSGAIGAGLIFAGVTDTCMMGNMLAKMPWNQASSAGQTCQR
ncbi:MAG: rhodanese-like domain-containing protein [Planctomycetota bacterium]